MVMCELRLVYIFDALIVIEVSFGYVHAIMIEIENLSFDGVTVEPYP